MDDRIRSARNDLFQELKPRCIELSQLAVRDDGSASHTKPLIRSANDLYKLLDTKCRRIDGVFDEKLADYVFFPLSQILRKKQKYTDRLSEVSIKCVRILLEYGWRKKITLDLAKQLLILLTFVAGGIPGKEKTAAPEELVIEAYGALAALFQDLAATTGGASSLLDSGTIPALGHTVTVLLEGVTNGLSPEAQIQALEAVGAVWHCIKDPSALTTFLPGTVSALTKCLMPQTGSRRTRKTLLKALEVLGQVLTSTLSDIQTRGIRNDKRLTSHGSGTGVDQKPLTKSWLSATAGQIKLALSNVIRLRTHESVDVRKALNALCTKLLDECHDTLSEAASMLVETCMALSGLDEDDPMSLRTTTLVDLASIHPDLSELIKSNIYNWITSLPRVMQANDEKAKLVALGNLSKGHKLLGSLNLESSVLDDALENALRDSITVTLDSSPSHNLEEVDFDLNSQSALTFVADNVASAHFDPVIMAEQSQVKTRDQLLSMISHLGTRQSQLHMASDMLEYAREASGPSLLSAYWLAFQVSKAAASINKDIDEFFESSLTFSDEQATSNQELFFFSQSLLTETDERTADWRLQAIALEVIADTAQRMKQEFKAELVDTLYPVAQLLGAPNGKLREHAITCLNIISQSCGYKNASELIVDNVDYMINAISLRLNTFDISPQAPQVLVMMIRLTGPSLLLYLDDVVGSIFAALDNFHGYHRLVQVLFSVLAEIVAVGSTSNHLRIEDTPTISHQKKAAPAPTIIDILSLIPTSSSKPSPDPETHDDFPRAPWKSAKTLLDEAEAATNPLDIEDDDDDENGKGDQNTDAKELTPLPPTKTYSLLTSIFSLTQKYLTSASPHLRSLLLSLLSTSTPALSTTEDTFLPLLNDVWPVLIPRLSDPEAYIRIAACSAVSAVVTGAGDFCATRVTDEWGRLMILAREAKGEVEKARKGKEGRGTWAQSSRVWDAVVGLLVAIIGNVRINAEMVDDVITVLGKEVWEREDVREVLEVINRDAVWFAMQIGGMNEVRERPRLEGFSFVSLESVMSEV